MIGQASDLLNTILGCRVFLYQIPDIIQRKPVLKYLCQDDGIRFLFNRRS